MPDSPTPEEREQKDKEQKAKEAAEQAALPYKWTQTIKDVDITVPVAGNLKGRDLEVKFTKNILKVAVKGQEPIIDVSRPILLTPTFCKQTRSMFSLSSTRAAITLLRNAFWLT